MAEFAILHSPQHRIQLVELHLTYVDLTQEGARKGPQLLRRFHQPVQHGIGGNLEDASGGANAQAFGQARQHVDDELD